MKRILALTLLLSLAAALFSCSGTYYSNGNSYDTAETMKIDSALEAPENDEAPIPEFKVDLSAYEQYMDPEGELRDAFLTLVNKERPVGSEYDPGTLEYLPQKWCVYSGENQARMVPYAAKALTAMLEEAATNGFDDVKVTLAYRTFEKEQQLYNKYMNEERAAHPGWTEEQLSELVQTYKAYPGKGEHMTGLCADMHNLYNEKDYDLSDFQYTLAYKWFKENCWKFGFILRFPEGKEEITGYTFESWHYRYVGRYHAERIFRMGLTLEEYLEKMK